MTQEELKEQLLDHVHPGFRSELLDLINQHVAEVIGEYEKGLSSQELEAIYQKNGGNVGREEIFEVEINRLVERNELRAEQRRKAGL